MKILAENECFVFFFFQKVDNDVRVTFLPNANGEKGKDNYLNKIILAALQHLPAEKATDFVLSLLKDDVAFKTLEKGEKLTLPVSFYLRQIFSNSSCNFFFGC